MILNILHRPDEPSRRHLFELEQGYAHANGIRTTILMTAAALADPGQVELAKQEAATHGDEIGLSFHGLTHPSITALTGYGQEALWLFSLEHKRAIVDYLARRFAEEFGAPPTSVAAYHLDSSTMAIVRELVPSVRVAVAGCFEEGVRVFHGCNHSWYLFNEGMPWGPWYPSKTHTLRPARDEDDWCGIVAVPHLMRDMVLSYEGRNDFWASHPPNVMRGMGYEGEDCPYDRNLIDMFRWQERFNDGYSYYNSFVSTAWLAEHHAIDDRPEVAQSLYRQQLDYLGSLMRDGALEATTLTEFADWFRANRAMGEPEVYFAKELLYGSGKHYVWYLDPDQRVLLDATQGGSIGDLRPYAGEVEVRTGPERPELAFGSYPYLIQSQHRTGMQNHFQDGSRSTALLRVDDETVDLATVRARVARVVRGEAGEVVVELEPVEVRIAGCDIRVTSRVSFRRGGVTVIRRGFELPDTLAGRLVVTERVKLAPGVTEYPQAMHGVTAGVSGEREESLEYAYNGRMLGVEAARWAQACVPSVSTTARLVPADGARWRGAVEEGHLFSPFVTIVLSRAVGGAGERGTGSRGVRPPLEEETEVWLELSKA